MSKRSLPLGELKKGVRARIVSVSASSEDMIRNLLEMGLIEG
ncbi:ferrous iron transport protein A, partial [bacterium]|nr:ferrous iron transport protein A [bacterium]